MSHASEEHMWLKQGQAKRIAVRKMFADISSTYDRANSIMTFRQHIKWREHAVAALQLTPGSSVLDVCCGTGDFLIPLQREVGSSGRVVGVDFCRPMLEIARDKIKDQTKLLVGDACDLPLSSAQFDAVTVGWGLRNVPDLNKALTEIARVTRSGGRFASLDMSRPQGLIGKIGEWLGHKIIPIMGKKLGASEAYNYLPKSTLTYVSKADLATLLEEAGFTNITTKDIMFGNVCMHLAVKK